MINEVGMEMEHYYNGLGYADSNLDSKEWFKNISNNYCGYYNYNSGSTFNHTNDYGYNTQSSDKASGLYNFHYQNENYPIYDDLDRSKPLLACTQSFRYFCTKQSAETGASVLTCAY